MMKTYSIPEFKSKLSVEERRKSDALVYLILTILVLILSVVFSL